MKRAFYSYIIPLSEAQTRPSGYTIYVLFNHSESWMNTPALEILKNEINSPRVSKEKDKTVMDGND